MASVTAIPNIGANVLRNSTIFAQGGVFVEASSSPISVGSMPVTLVAGDFDRSGTPDFLVGNRDTLATNNSDPIVVLLRTAGASTITAETVGTPVEFSFSVPDRPPSERTKTGFCPRSWMSRRRPW